MLNYKYKLNNQGTLLYDRPRKVILPPEGHKYLTINWASHYTWSKLSYIIYGTVNYAFLLMSANNVTNPWNHPEQIRFLKSEYLNEVIIE